MKISVLAACIRCLLTGCVLSCVCVFVCVAASNEMCESGRGNCQLKKIVDALLTRVDLNHISGLMMASLSCILAWT